MATARRRLVTLIAGILAAWLPGAASAQDTIRLKVVGGLADVSQYVRYEEPFWRTRITELTNGRVTIAFIHGSRSKRSARQTLARAAAPNHPSGDKTGHRDDGRRDSNPCAP